MGRVDKVWATASAVAWAESMTTAGGGGGRGAGWVSGGGGGGEGFVEVDADDVAGDGVVGPAFFDERDEERAGFFGGAEAEGVAGGEVGVGLDGGGGGEDEDFGGGLGLIDRAARDAHLSRRWGTRI